MDAFNLDSVNACQNEKSHRKEAMNLRKYIFFAISLCGTFPTISNSQYRDILVQGCETFLLSALVAAWSQVGTYKLMRRLHSAHSLLQQRVCDDLCKVGSGALILRCFIPSNNSATEISETLSSCFINLGMAAVFTISGYFFRKEAKILQQQRGFMPPRESEAVAHLSKCLYYSAAGTAGFAGILYLTAKYKNP